VEETKYDRKKKAYVSCLLRKFPTRQNRSCLGMDISGVGGVNRDSKGGEYG
jgi:hypothetical protein